jgi:hypothetical protein
MAKQPKWGEIKAAAERNRKISAAAPEMYEALKAIQEWLLFETPINAPDIWNKQFIKANNLTAKVLASIDGGK